jgi:hypothetical protein
MITEAFDPKTEEIIKVSRDENAKKVDACILTFSHQILQAVLEQHECTKIGDLYSSNGANPVYGFCYAGKEFAVYMSPVGAPGCVADIEDSLSLIQTDKYVVFGGSGCLNKEIARGKVMVPTAATATRAPRTITRRHRITSRSKQQRGSRVHGGSRPAFCAGKDLDHGRRAPRNAGQF